MELTLIMHRTEELKNFESLLYGQSYKKDPDITFIVSEFESNKKYVYKTRDMGEIFAHGKEYYVFVCVEESPIFN